MNAATQTLQGGTSSNARWWQLVVGVVCMIATANIQYAWTLFVPEIQGTFGWARAEIQIAFTIFVLVQTWLAPIEGYFIDRSEEHTSELQTLMRISYAVFCLNKNTTNHLTTNTN